MMLLLHGGAFATLRSAYRKEKSHVPDLRVQLDVFDDQRDTDEELSNQGPPGIDLSSHVEVFYAILGQVGYLHTHIHTHTLVSVTLFTGEKAV